MNLCSAGVTGPLRWAAVNRAIEGESLSGDRHVVRATAAGALVAVIDGLGHGEDAASAAARAAEAVEAGGFDGVVGALLACHVALARTRGAVLSLVEIVGSRLTWIGVGNVEGIVVRGLPSARPRERLALSGGVVGHVLPTLRPSTLALHRGDLIVLGTDGLASDMMERLDALGAPDVVVAKLMARCRTGRDDALAFAARFDGAASC